MAMEIQTEMADYEAQAKRGGWKKMPQCEFVMRGTDGKLYCTYYYNQARAEMQEKLDPRLVEDIGLDQGPESDIWKGNLVRECSVKECPSLSHKLANKL
jgi:hypothetical protein